MLLEDIAVRCLINSRIAKDSASALEALREVFEKEFPKWKYDEWNRPIPDEFSENIIANDGKNGAVSVRFLIKDLDVIAKCL